MSEETMRLFEDAIAGWQNNLATCRGGDGAQSIYPPEFVRVMFHVAAEFGSVSCHALDNETLCFDIGKTETRTYTFLPFHAIRVLLAAVAHVFWDCNTNPTFNVYGDKAEIALAVEDKLTDFYVETGNTNGKPLYFLIRKMDELEHS